MVPPTGTAGGLRWRQWFAAAWASIVVDAARKSNASALLGVDLEEMRTAVYAVHEHRSASADYAEGLRASDPKRVAAYFLKHSLLRDKEYQHLVPAAWRGEGDGPGRFWGYWGLARADLATRITPDEAITLARTMRRWQRSKGGTRRASVWRIDRETGQVRRRTARRRLRAMPRTRGFLLVNDGPAAALALSSVLRT
jgi:hypothetical protein